MTLDILTQMNTILQQAVAEHKNSQEHVYHHRLLAIVARISGILATYDLFDTKQKNDIIMLLKTQTPTHIEVVYNAGLLTPVQYRTLMGLIDLLA